MTTTTVEATATEDKKGAKDEPRRSLVPVSNGWMTLYNKMIDPVKFIGMVGQDIHDSKMFGTSNAAQGRMLALMFLTKGIDPFEWKPRNHVIGGNVTMAAEAMLADLRTECGGSHKVVCRTPEKAAIEITLGKQKQLFEFTLAEARQEDYAYTNAANDGKVPKKLANGEDNPAAWKTNWSTPRRRMQMLWARVVSDAVGVMAPEVASGKLTPEEMGVTHEEAVLDSSAAFVEPEATPTTKPTGGAPGEIIDGEFTVTKDSSSGNEAATTQVNQPTSQPESPPFVPDPPKEPEPTGPAHVFTQPAPTEAEQKTALLRELKALKDELMTPEQYKAVIDKRGVDSATKLDLAELAKIVSGLRARKEAKSGKDALSQWAEGAVQPKN